MTKTSRILAVSALGLATALSACSKEGDLVIEQGVGIQALRSLCPAVGVPDYTGNVTLFRGADRSLGSLDVSATMTNVTSTCDDTGERIYATANFDVLAQRTDTSGARSLTLPYYSTVLRGGSAVVSKEVGQVVINFADGQARASATGTAGAYVDRAAATLPEEIREEITRRRRPGDTDAAIDPLTKPEVRAAVARASFELLVGFQLTEEQLAYNATR